MHEYACSNRTLNICLENPLLSLPPPPDEASAPASVSTLNYDLLPNNFIDTLEQLMLAYIQEPDLSLEFAANICNTSKRTLQRTLTEMGTHYSELLANARFRAACQMLQAPGMKVNDVAQRLGYSDSAHFSRAFRRIAGVAPKEYRRQFIH
jgi:AraC-like DNA-binding protein